MYMNFFELEELVYSAVPSAWSYEIAYIITLVYQYPFLDIEDIVYQERKLLKYRNAYRFIYDIYTIIIKQFETEMNVVCTQDEDYHIFCDWKYASLDPYDTVIWEKLYDWLNSYTKKTIVYHDPIMNSWPF